MDNLWISGGKLQSPTLFIGMALLAGLLPAAAMAESAIDAAIPANAAWVARLDLHRVLESPLGAELFVEVADNTDAINWFLDAAFGFELDQIDQVWIAGGTSEAGLVLLQGRFVADEVAAKIRGMPGWRSVRYEGLHQVSRYADKQGREQMAAVLAADLIAMGDRIEMEAMLVRWQAAPDARGAIRAGVRQVQQSRAHMAAAVLDAGALAGQPEASLLVESAWFEGRIDKDLTLMLKTRALDNQIAEGIQHMVQGLALLLEYHPEVIHNPAYLHAVRTLAVQRAGRDLTISTAILGELLLQRAAERRSVTAE